MTFPHLQLLAFTPPGRWADSYRDGYRNGRADAHLGHRSLVALTSNDVDYARGYRAGQDEARAERGVV